MAEKYDDINRKNKSKSKTENILKGIRMGEGTMPVRKNSDKDGEYETIERANSFEVYNEKDGKTDNFDGKENRASVARDIYRTRANGSFSVDNEHAEKHKIETKEKPIFPPKGGGKRSVERGGPRKRTP